MDNEKVFSMRFSKVYPLLIQKAERKNRSRQEVLEVTAWLTGYSASQLMDMLDSDITYGVFFETHRLCIPIGKGLREASAACGWSRSKTH